MERTDNATYFDKDGIERFRQPVNCFARCMWYIKNWYNITSDIKWWDVVTDENRNIKLFRPVFNNWKRSEFADRKVFLEWKTCPRVFDIIQQNQNFISKYSTI